jgi:hypothetical protein
VGNDHPFHIKELTQDCHPARAPTYWGNPAESERNVLTHSIIIRWRKKELYSVFDAKVTKFLNLDETLENLIKL